MAIALIGANTETGGATSTSPYTFDVPTNTPAAGNMLLLGAVGDYGSGRRITSWPSDWDLIHEAYLSTYYIQLLAAVSDGAMAANSTFGAPGYSEVVYVQFELTGAESYNVTPIDSDSQTNGSGGTTTIPSVDAVADGSIWLGVAGYRTTGATFTIPGGFTNIGSYRASSSSIHAAYKAANTGATGTDSFSYLPTWMTGTLGMSAVIAPAADAGGPFPHHIKRARNLSGGIVA